MYLIDTNVWLELLLRQKRSEEVHQFLQTITVDDLSLTEFTLYSIGLIVTRLNKEEIFDLFLTDILEESGVKRIILSPSHLRQLLEAMQMFQLDFDDAYQYIAAKKDDLILVSFDTDFDRTDIGRKTPAGILESL